MRLFIFSFDNGPLLMDEKEGFEHVLSVAITAPDLTEAYKLVADHCSSNHDMSDDPADYQYDVEQGNVTLLLPVVVTPEQKTYKIIRHYKDINKGKETVKTGLSLAEAQEHCSDPGTSCDDWFEGFATE